MRSTHISDVMTPAIKHESTDWPSELSPGVCTTPLSRVCSNPGDFQTEIWWEYFGFAYTLVVFSLYFSSLALLSAALQTQEDFTEIWWEYPGFVGSRLTLLSAALQILIPHIPTRPATRWYGKLVFTADGRSGSTLLKPLLRILPKVMRLGRQPIELSACLVAC